METAPVHPTISEAEVQHLAHLARLQLTPEERETMREDLSSILGYFQQLSAVETGGLEEMQRPVALVNVLRDDQPSQPSPLKCWLPSRPRCKTAS